MNTNTSTPNPSSWWLILLLAGLAIWLIPELIKKNKRDSEIETDLAFMPIASADKYWGKMTRDPDARCNIIVIYDTDNEELLTVQEDKNQEFQGLYTNNNMLYLGCTEFYSDKEIHRVLVYNPEKNNFIPVKQS